MPNNQQLTIGEVIELQPGDQNNKAWINGEFTGLVSNIVPKTSKAGRTYWTAIISDPESPDLRLDTMFFVNPMKYNNCVCRFGGQGMTREEYNGTPKVGLSQKTLINVVSSAQPPQQQRTQQRPVGNQQQNRTQQSPAAKSGALVIDGQTIGMALKLAGDFMISGGMPMDPQTLHEYASDIIRVSEHLKRGKLAPKQSERTQHNDPLNDPADLGGDEGVQHDPPEEPSQEQPPRSKPQPGPDNSAFPADSGDEEVPF